jgi:hypothetical protein
MLVKEVTKAKRESKEKQVRQVLGDYLELSVRRVKEEKGNERTYWNSRSTWRKGTCWC